MSNEWQVTRTALSALRIAECGLANFHSGAELWKKRGIQPHQLPLVAAVCIAELGCEAARFCSLTQVTRCLKFGQQGCWNLGYF